jgi:hypothetical protein
MKRPKRLNGLHDLKWLRQATYDEGRGLAEMVRRGEIPRSAVEEALRKYGDAEPAIALDYLDDWGIKE